MGGASGSGKSTICKLIRQRLGEHEVATLSFDSYYHSIKEGEDPATHNFDHPEALDISLLVEHLSKIKVSDPIDISRLVVLSVWALRSTHVVWWLCCAVAAW